MNLHTIDPRLDLVLERVVDLPPELIWAGWTKPEHLVHWFTPAPWKTLDAEVDLRPGGGFRTTMQSSEGQTFPMEGCYLEVVENRRLVWTDCLISGYRPSPLPSKVMGFTAVIMLEPQGKGTKYTS